MLPRSVSVFLRSQIFVLGLCLLRKWDQRKWDQKWLLPVNFDCLDCTCKKHYLEKILNKYTIIIIQKYIWKNALFGFEARFLSLFLYIILESKTKKDLVEKIKILSNHFILSYISLGMCWNEFQVQSNLKIENCKNWCSPPRKPLTTWVSVQKWYLPHVIL